MSAPLVSFIVPVYNGARYLSSALASLQAQTFRDFEVLMGDDASTDNSVELMQPFLRDPRFKLIRWQPNRGMHHGVVVLLNAARGQYWCPPGQDDLLEPRLLEKRVPMLASHPEAVLIHGAAKWIDEQGKPFVDDTIQRALPQMERRLPESMPAQRMLRVLLQHDILNWPSTLVRLDITRQVLPYFSPYWVCNLDWSLWILLAATGHDFLWDAEPMIQYRRHSEAISASEKQQVTRQIERKLAPLSALRAASLYSSMARALWVEQRKALYRWWLVTAVSLWRQGALTARDMAFAVEACYGGQPRGANLWRELAVHGLPAVLQYRREKAANRNQLFPVAGLSLINDPLFKSS